MRKPLMQRIFLDATDAIFSQERNRRIIGILLFSTVAIFGVETMLMVILELVLDIPEPLVWFVDGFLLIILLFPLNYFFVIQPMLRQIDEHRRTNLELAKSNEILERFFEISDILIAYMDADFRFARVNMAYAQADSHTPDFYTGKYHFDLFPNPENEVIFRHVVQTGEPFFIYDKPFDYAGHPERGITYWDWSLLPIKTVEGKVVGVILVLLDRTAHKQAQTALEDSERRFRAVFHQTFQQILLLGPDGRAILANQTALDFSGLSPSDVQGRCLWEFPVWEKTGVETETLQEFVEKAIGGATVRSIYAVRSQTGQLASLDVTIKPMVDDHGDLLLLICEARDITERVLFEEALRVSDTQVKRLYEAEKHAHDLAETMRCAALSLSASLDSDAVMDTLLDFLRDITGYTSAHIEILEDPDHLMVRLARGEKNWEPERRLLGRRLEIDELKIFHPILREHSREVVSCSDTSTYHGTRYYPGNQYIGSWFAIPVLAGDQVVGLCIAEHVQPNYFTREEVEWAVALINQAAIAIQNAWLFEQILKGREQLQALSRRLVEVQETERGYIARELHDEAGQALASLMVGLRLLEREGGNPAAVAARSQELKQIADGVLENLHRLAINLRPTALDHLGLVAALRQHTNNLATQHGLEVQFDVIGDIGRLPGETETAIYRIIQEALTNVIRHARASRVDVLLEQRGSAFSVIIEDNGVGFDPKAPTNNQLGMIGMHERAVMLGGVLSVESAPGAGSTIILEVPCPSVS